MWMPPRAGRATVVAVTEKVSRRGLLRIGLGGVTGLLLPAAVGTAVGARLAVETAHRSPSVPRFAVPLPIPAVLAPVSTAGGVDTYEIRQTTGEAEILPGLRTPIWGYNGSFPGPTIEARQGRPVAVKHRNELPVPTVVHLHGGITPPESDGHPLDLVLPRGAHDWPSHHGDAKGPGGIAHGERVYRYPNQQAAATLWYHDHRMDFTGPAVYRGLAGFYFVRDAAEAELPLPRDGRDIPLMIQDRYFNEDGSFFYPSLDPSLRETPGVQALFSNGVKGDVILVNGKPWPFHAVDGARYRLRLLNASNARTYRVRLDPPPPGGKGLVQIASDAGLLPRPLPLDEIRLGSGERYEVVVDFSRYAPGTKVFLANTLGDGRLGQIMRFDVGARVVDDSAVPDRLAPDDEPLPSADAPSTESFFFLSGQGGLPSTINYRTFRPDRIDATARLGQTEVWDVSIDNDHPFHPHLGHFQIIERNGMPPEPHDTGWKDTVYIGAGQVRLAMRFAGFTGRYVVHCHNLEHGDMMMMANYEVI
jgi:spore coat protein A, manganese oxidase